MKMAKTHSIVVLLQKEKERKRDATRGSAGQAGKAGGEARSVRA